jgi:hypothetical protein
MAADVPFMKSHGITGVVNMCIEWPGPQAEYSRVGIDQLHLPTVDTTPPSLADLERGIAFIAKQKELGGRVFIHCKVSSCSDSPSFLDLQERCITDIASTVFVFQGGRGRAATMALAWYVSQGLSPKAGMLLLKSKRSVVSSVVVDYAAIQQLAGAKESETEKETDAL